MQIMDTNIINGFLDISSFLLVEGTADSETDYGILQLCHDHINMAYDEDDAESCSEYTSGSEHALLGCDQEVLSLDHEHEVNEDCSEYNGGGHEGEKRWKGYKMWLRENGNMMAIDDDEDEAESKNGININREVMDEMEDWLFWETCMAVGYP